MVSIALIAPLSGAFVLLSQSGFVAASCPNAEEVELDCEMCSTSSTRGFDVISNARCSAQFDIAASLRGDRCGFKCMREPCLSNATADGCFCDGFSRDDLESDAICLSRDICTSRCEFMGGECSGVDVQKDKPRCFFHNRIADGVCTSFAQDQMQPLLHNDLFDFFVKVSGVSNLFRAFSNKKCASDSRHQVALGSEYQKNKLCSYVCQSPLSSSSAQCKTWSRLSEAHKRSALCASTEVCKQICFDAKEQSCNGINSMRMTDICWISSEVCSLEGLEHDPHHDWFHLTRQGLNGEFCHKKCQASERAELAQHCNEMNLAAHFEGDSHMKSNLSHVMSETNVCRISDAPRRLLALQNLQASGGIFRSSNQSVSYISALSSPQTVATDRFSVRIIQLGRSAQHAIVVLSDPSYEKRFPAVIGHTSWLAGVLTVQRFSQDGSSASGRVSFQVSVEGNSRKIGQQQVFLFDGASVRDVTSVARLAPTEDGWLSVSLPNVEACSFTVLIAENTNECSLAIGSTAPICQQPRVCSYVSGSYACVCPQGSQDVLGECLKVTNARRLQSDGVSDIQQSGILQIQAASPTYHSWRVAGVSFYDNANCQGTPIGPDYGSDSNSSPHRHGHSVQDMLNPSALSDFWTLALFNPNDTAHLSFDIDFGTTNIRSVSVSQVPGYASDLRATLKTAESPVPALSQPGVLIQTGLEATRAQLGHVIASDTTSQRDGAASCLSLKCSLRQGSLHTTYHPAESRVNTSSEFHNSCQCAAWCQAHLECRSWSFLSEAHTELVTTSHQHALCVLFSENWNEDDVVESLDGWVSGSAGIYVDPLNVTVSQSGSTSITLTGWNFPVLGHVQRIKIVRDDLDEQDIDFVSGISCSGLLCHPGPVDGFSSTDVSWDVSLIAAVEDIQYRVYYCPGSCFSRSMWNRLAGSITVPASEHYWDVSPHDLSSVSNSAILSVHRPSGLVNTALWGVALVQAGQLCSDDVARTAQVSPVLRHQVYQHCGLLVYSGKKLPADALTWTGGQHLHGEYTFSSTDPKAECANRCKADSQCVGFHILPSQGFCEFFRGDADMAAVGFGSNSYLLQELADRLVEDVGYDSYILDCPHASSASRALSVDFLVDDITHGQYQVCVCSVLCQDDDCGRTIFDSIQECPADDKSIWTGIPGGNSERWLDVSSTFSDESYARGPYQQHRWTLARSFALPVSIHVDGSGMNHFSDSKLRFQKELCGSNNVDFIFLGDSTSDFHDDHAEYIFSAKNEPESGQVYHGCWCAGDNCQQDTAFDVTIGKLAYSARFDINNDYLFDPHQANSVEVAGQRLNATMDRITVIDCKGSCGISPPTELFQEFSVENGFVASDFADPRLHQDCCSELNNVNADFKYWQVENRHCAHGYLSPQDLSSESSSCESCVGSSCLGFDEVHNTMSFCLDDNACRGVCDAHDECVSFSMHRHLNRCFLHTSVCSDVSAWSFDASYVLNIKQVTIQNDVLGFAAETWSSSLLDFAPFTLPLGTFKVCACDYELLEDGGTCSRSDKRDYAVELGTIHVTGASCMFTRAIQSRWHCHQQKMGGHRCIQSASSSVGATDDGSYTVALSDVSHGLCSVVSDADDVVAVEIVSP